MGDCMILEAANASGGMYLLRIIMSALDGIACWFLVNVYNLFFKIANADIFSDASTVAGFSTRIYSVIGIIMLFKLASSVITYILDPDKLTDSKGGFTSIIKNIVITFVLFLVVPLIFKYAMAFQYIVLSDNTIGRLITGKQGATYNNVGEDMAATILGTFIRPSELYGDVCDDINFNEECYNKLKSDDNRLLAKDENLADNYACFYDRDDKVTNPIFTNPSAAIASAAIGSKCGENHKYQYLLNMASTKSTFNRVGRGGVYAVRYTFLISTACILFSAYILLLFCIDIAKRLIKLVFLEMIAPIPIVTYMNDGGQGVFKKWRTTCLSTYADLFIRLAGIYFAVFMIATVIQNKNITISKWEWNDASRTVIKTASEPVGLLAYVFIILGFLMFAKELPKLVEEITGVKLAGDFTLNPMKKLEQVPLVGNAAAKGLGLAGRTAGNLAAGLWHGTGGQLATMAGKAIKNKYKGSDLEKIFNGAGGAIGKKYDALDAWTGNRLSRIGADVEGTVGAGFTKKRDDRRMAQLNQFTTAENKLEERALEKIKSGAAGRLSEKYTAYIENINAARNAGNATLAAQLQTELNSWMNSNDPNGAASQYIDFITNGSFTDDYGNVLTGKAAEKAIFYSDGREFKDNTMKDSLYKDYVAAAKNAGIAVAPNASKMHSDMGKAKGEIGDMKRKQISIQEATSKK